MGNEVRTLAKRIAIRVDADEKIGFGHLQRCLRLAKRLLELKHSVAILSRNAEDPAVLKLAIPGLDLVAIQYHPDKVFDEKLDADATSEKAQELEIEILICDHYEISEKWEKALKQTVDRLVAIDDLGNRRHSADVVIDSDPSPQKFWLYRGLVPDACLVFTGLQFLLLPDEMIQLDRWNRQVSGPKRASKILLFLGAGQVSEFVTKVLLAIPPKPGVTITVVASPETWSSAKLQSRLAGRDDVIKVFTGSSLLPHILNADLCIGSGGVSMLERLYLGAFSASFAIADNQISQLESLASQKLIQYLGDLRRMDMDSLARTLSNFLLGFEEGAGPTDLAWQVVDKWGLSRVVEIIDPSENPKLISRRFKESDIPTTFQWANDPIARYWSLNQSPVSIAEHCDWFQSQLSGQNINFIFENQDGLPVGQVRFTRCENYFELSYFVDSVFRGRQLAVQILSHAIKNFMSEVGSAPILARVKEGNLASLRILSKLGFIKIDRNPDGVLKLSYSEAIALESSGIVT